MSFVAVAIGGAAVVGAVGTSIAADRAGRAAEAGADSAAQAQIISTELQIEEIRRQYDYQQQILLPQIQQQYNAQGAFADLLGIGGYQVGQNQETGFTPEARSRAEEDAYRQSNIDVYDRLLAEGRISQADYDQAVDQIRSRPYDEERMAAENLARGPQFPGQGATQFQRGDRGEFIDPNLDPTRLADINTYGDTVRGNLMAGTSADADPYRNYVDANRIAAGTAGEDARVARARDVTMTGTRGGDTLEGRRGGDTLVGRRGADSLEARRAGDTLAGRRGADSLEARRGAESLAATRAGVSLMDERGNVLNAPGTLAEDVVRGDIAGRSLAAGAAGTGVYGDDFQTSPGYEFAVEEMNRATDRIRSRGGNVGGRAIIEAQRRAQGLANQEYYNWAAGRERDLSRRAGAEASDAARLDAAAYDYMGRRTRDIARGDDFAAQDIARGDMFAREDLARGDRFAEYDMARADRFADVDLARVDRFAGTDMARLDDLNRTDIMRADELAGADVARLDQFAGQDISRGDIALAGYEDQRIADVGRRDAAYMDYIRRREGDAARLDAAARQEDSLLASDQARRDQAYYNYISNLGRVAGFGGGPAATAVNASQAAGAGVAGAYRGQGANLSNIYSNLGMTQAQIEGQRAAGVTNAITGGIQNWVTYNAQKPTAPPTMTTGVPA